MAWFGEIIFGANKTRNEEVKDRTSWTMCVSAGLLVILYIYVFTRTYLGTKSKFVLMLAALYIVSNLAFGISIVLFNRF